MILNTGQVAAKIMTAALTAAAFSGGDHEKSCNFLKEYRRIPRMISKNRFSRRPAGIPEFVRRGLADWLASAAHGADALQIGSPKDVVIHFFRCWKIQPNFVRSYAVEI